MHARDLFSGESEHRKTNGSRTKLGPPTAVYEYHDETDTLLFQCLRYAEPEKTFRQRRPDGVGGWLWNLNGVRRVLFGLPELATRTEVFVAEGERDVLALRAIGMAATTNPCGAGKWLPGHAEQLAASGCLRVVVLPDRDEPGRKHGQSVAASCASVGLGVKVVDLPELPAKGDVSDWLAAGHTAEELAGLVAAAPHWAPSTEAAAEPGLGPDAGVSTPLAIRYEQTASAQATFNRTDSGNAEYFAARHGRDVRFDHRRGRWLLWGAHSWKVDADAEIRRRAKGAMRQRFQDAGTLEDPEARGSAAKWAIASESRGRLDALLFLAQAEPVIADAGDGWDANPMLLGVPNGVIDLRTGDLRPGRREDRITMGGTVPYDPAATCPRWEQFNTEVFIDPALIGFVHRAVGYTLTGMTSEQCLFLCYGTGANGKGTFTNTLKWILGDYAWNMPFATIEIRDRAAIPNDLAALVGRRFVITSETNDGTRLNEARIKALTGCDPITARFLHQEFFEFEPAAKFWLSVNHRPVVRDDSRGFWRRIRLLPFTQMFPVSPRLADELRGEASGILAWAVRGCLAWQRDGLKPPPVVLDATREYQRDSDPLAEFLDEACELDVNAETGASELYEHYKRWAERHGLSELERITSTMFGRKMAERFAKRKRGPITVYQGLSRRGQK